MCDGSQIIDNCRTLTFFDEDAHSSGQANFLGGLSYLVEERTLIDFTITLDVQDLPEEFICKPCFTKRFLLIFIMSN
jgi:hypothetical protein